MHYVWCRECGCFMVLQKVGVIIERTDARLQRGDLYRCPRCGRDVVDDFGEPYDNPALTRVVSAYSGRRRGEAP